MSRKKFRVWDLQDKKFYYSDKGYQGHFVLSLDGNFTNLQNGAGGQEVIVQQYIGLQDSTGKDIYEGDLVEFDDSEHNEQPAKGIAEVIFTTDFSVVDAPGYGLWFKNGFHKNMLGDIKVVGNIFENWKLKSKKEVRQEKDISEDLREVFEDIDKLDSEREAWKKMFDLQSKLVVGLEMDKIRLEKENQTLQNYLDNVYKNLKTLTKEE